MELQDKLQILKDIKTARKLARQARTMMYTIGDTVSKEDANSQCAKKIYSIAKALDAECDKFDDGMNGFKKEYGPAYYQMTIFDAIQSNQ